MGAKFWMKVFNDLKPHGVADILVAVTNGLKGMAEALEAVFPAAMVRRVIYTTNAIESINARLRNITADWGRAAKNWKEAMNQFAILYAERFTGARG